MPNPNTIEQARTGLATQLQIRKRQLELATDPARGPIDAEGIGGVHIEQALGRAITRSSDPTADFIDSQLGPISLKGPIPPRAGNVEGLANSAIKDALTNTATKALFVDLTGLSTDQATTVKSLVKAATSGTSKIIYFLE